MLRRRFLVASRILLQHDVVLEPSSISINNKSGISLSSRIWDEEEMPSKFYIQKTEQEDSISYSCS